MRSVRWGVKLGITRLCWVVYCGSVQDMETKTKIRSYEERYREMRDALVEDIQLLRREGMTFQEIGDQLGVTRGAVNNFLKGYNLRSGKAEADRD